MTRRPPRCPDCSSADARPIFYGEPPLDLDGSVERGEIALGGCVVGDNDPAWHCSGCGHRFGIRGKPDQALLARTPEEWAELVKTMLPQPVSTNEAGEVLGGAPVVVIVRVTSAEITILLASWDWVDSHRAVQKGRSFAKAPLRTPPPRIAQLIAMARGKRISQYRWCPRCQHSKEPEHMHGVVCQGCAERVLGVVH